MYKYFLSAIAIVILLITGLIIGCESGDNSSTDILMDEEILEETLDIETDTDTDVDVDIVEESIPLSFNEIVNNPYSFESKKDNIYLFRLTDRHNIKFKLVNQPKIGQVQSLQINDKSKDFGTVYLIVISDDICPETIERNLDGLYEYILKLRIYHVQNVDKNYIIVWADLLGEPEKVKI